MTDRSSTERDTELFDRWRNDRVASMTLVDLHTDGGLYYYESPYNCTVWVFAGVDSLIISYWLKGSGSEQVRAELRRLLDALHGRGDPGALKQWGYPNFAARRDPGTGHIVVACSHPGDWCGLTNIEPLPVLWDQLPRGWPETDRSRLAELAAERVRIAERSNTFSTLYPVGRALVSLSRHADAERLFRRALAICEKTSGPEHADTALTLQAIGVALAHQSHYAEAEEILRRALAVWEKVSGPEHANVASALTSIGRVLERRGNPAEADALHRRARSIRDKAQGQVR